MPDFFAYDVCCQWTEMLALGEDPTGSHVIIEGSFAVQTYLHLMCWSCVEAHSGKLFIFRQDIIQQSEAHQHHVDDIKPSGVFENHLSARK